MLYLRVLGVALLMLTISLLHTVISYVTAKAGASSHTIFVLHTFALLATIPLIRDPPFLGRRD
jgi:hypothetical protein